MGWLRDKVVAHKKRKIQAIVSTVLDTLDSPEVVGRIEAMASFLGKAVAIGHKAYKREMRRK